ncbi:MAG TPA: hypothetical protein VKZ63_19580 [Kofleriaceae bacterium]|nr:hypothetical protein [Kofleriaceae bacterium]
MIRLATLLLSTALVVSGASCSDEKKAASAAGDTAGEAKATEVSQPAQGGDTAAEQPAAGAAADPELEERGVAFMVKMADIMDANKADCDKMAAELNRFLDSQKGLMAEMKAYGEKQTPEQKKAFSDKYKSETDAVMAKMTPAIEACQDSKALQEAMGKMASLAGE